MVQIVCMWGSLQILLVLMLFILFAGSSNKNVKYCVLFVKNLNQLTCKGMRKPISRNYSSITLTEKQRIIKHSFTLLVMLTNF